MRPPIYIAVINDIATDQRVQRVAYTLAKSGHPITIIGRKLKRGLPVTSPLFKTKRFKFIVNKGFLFYAAYNVRLFFYLMLRKKGIIVSNDTDTLIACFLASKLKAATLIFDAHELFPEVPELVDKKFVKRFWIFVESMFLPGTKHAYTVSGGLATEYQKRYGIEMKVVRNLPFKRKVKGKEDLKPPAIIYQGALNKGRGIEKVIRAMVFLKNIHFIIIGTGDIESELLELAKEIQVDEKVFFLGRKLPGEMREITPRASLGISLEENLALNYYHALPNKLFDYIQARVPVLCSDFPGMKNIVNQYDIGNTTSENDPEKLAAIINRMLTDHESRDTWKKNIEVAANELCWENEEKILMEVYEQAGLNFD